MNRKKRKRKESRSSIQRKLSELVWLYAGDFIRMGRTMEEKESLLNAACSAWNLACLPQDARARQLEHYMVTFVRFNPDASEEQIAGTRSNLKKLIQQKLKTFPADQRRIISARIFLSGASHRIEVASARFE